ncbi:MAG: hypothetical protein A2161_00900 [Candidatus Schekmanbacteria bacterium RBG_13_48_7]|uniref:Uncharacterized protein n=1 Tax=Candidatus Schekmanbacteria bacterium RBG_13_48_7 TaxID=1817878 RepID=A0A1F7RY80_9BACT|nr:MAG: hypothetical protein A2161_00900 [Candidatus Schekmanbacteria bacterium RBG_13_48_7]
MLKKNIGRIFHSILYPDGKIQIEKEEDSNPGLSGEFGLQDLMMKNKLEFPQKFIANGLEWDVEKSEPIDAQFYGKHEMNGTVHYRFAGEETVNNIGVFCINFQQKLVTKEPKTHSMAPSPFISIITGNNSTTGSAFFSKTQRLPVKYQENSVSKITIDLEFKDDEKNATSQTVNEVESNVLIELIK